jgi:hypothetical protein
MNSGRIFPNLLFYVLALEYNFSSKSERIPFIIKNQTLIPPIALCLLTNMGHLLFHVPRKKKTFVDIMQHCGTSGVVMLRDKM